jgi:hypothetical protein
MPAAAALPSFSEGASWALFSEAFDGERSTVNSLITGNCANDFLNATNSLGIACPNVIRLVNLSKS